MVIRSYNHGRAEDSDSINDDAKQLTTATSTSTSTATTIAVSDAADTDTDSCEVCLLAHGLLYRAAWLAPRHGFALVPCGHARFCESCANRVAAEGGACPVCHTTITMVMRVFL